MRENRTGSVLLIVLIGMPGVFACKEETKPIGKVDTAQVAGLEPVAPPADAEESAAEEMVTEVAPSEEIEIVEAQGFRGACDTRFAGVSANDLIAIRNANSVRTVRLAGISIPDEMRLDAHNQLRIWLDKRSVGIEIDESVPSLDPAVYIFLCPEGTLINEELVLEGLAVPAKGSHRHAEALKKASVAALTAGRGVWATKN